MSQDSDHEQQGPSELNLAESSSSSVSAIMKSQESLEAEIVDIADKIEDIQARSHELYQRLAIRPRWPNHQQLPRKMPYTDDFLTRNDPTK